MKTRTLQISQTIFIAILLTIPLMLSAASPVLSNMEMSLFMNEVEDEMIRSFHQEETYRNLLNNALRRITPQVMTVQSSAVSDGAVNLMIVEVEEDMVESVHQEMASESILSAALYSLAESLNEQGMDFSELPSRIHFTVEMNLFLHKVEDEMLRDSHQQNVNSDLINKALRQLTYEIQRQNDESATLSGSFEGNIPSKEEINRFINEVETDADYFNTTLFTYSLLPTITN